MKAVFSVLRRRPSRQRFLTAAAPPRACGATTVPAAQLVAELRASLDLPAAASFKHVSPAGAAVAVPLSPAECAAYEVAEGGAGLTPLSLAYLRARQADPLCSFGDFAAVSDVVDVATATYLKGVVSDGIIAPGFEPEALAILAGKKGGGFIVLEAAPGFKPPAVEFREVQGLAFSQRRNDALVTAASLAKVVTRGGGPLPAQAQVSDSGPAFVVPSCTWLVWFSCQ